MIPPDTRLARFKPHLRVETVPAEAVYLISAEGVTVLSGAGIERAAPLLDGTRTVAELTRELAGIGALLERLDAAGLLEWSQDAGTRTPQAAYWSLAGYDAAAAAAAMAAAAVEIVALAGAAVEADAAEALARAGLTRASGAATASLVVCEDYLDPRLAAVNARQLAEGRPWLLVKPDGVHAWIGPVFRPRRGRETGGPCWTCLASRLELNRDGAHLLTRLLGERAFPQGRPASLPAGRAAALQLAVLALAGFLACGTEYNAITILDTLAMRTRAHGVRWRPQCASCGDPELVAARARRPPQPREGPPVTMPAREVLRRYRHLVDPVTGIVPALRRDPSVPPFQYGYVSGRNRAMPAPSVAAVKAGGRCVSGGRGVTADEAKAGALAEAIERYCGTRLGDEAVVRASYASLGGRAIHPAACMLFDPRQYAGRAAWNAACAPRHRVPPPFPDTEVTGWTPVWSLLTGEQRLLPTGLLYYGSGDTCGVVPDSNGSAAGGSFEDAVIRGFLELAERDAVALWWYNRLRRPQVCLRASGDGWVAAAPDRYRRLGRELWVLDLTSDLGIPVAAAIATDPAGAVLGFGAHFEPDIALRRALTELGQMLPGTSCRAALAPHLRPAPGAAASLTASEHAGLDGIRAITRAAGLDLLVLDQTRPDIEMPVVKVVVPGLRHFLPRFAPGRLFDVPVRMGWLDAPLGYDELNPVPLDV